MRILWWRILIAGLAAEAVLLGHRKRGCRIAIWSPGRGLGVLVCGFALMFAAALWAARFATLFIKLFGLPRRRQTLRRPRRQCCRCTLGGGL